MVARNTPIVEPVERELVITRVFDAPRDLVFKAWTDPRQAVQWWGPRNYPAAHLEMDVRPGGAWRGRLRSIADDRELPLGGVFREIVAPERVVFTFAWNEEGERGPSDTSGSSRSRNATGIAVVGPAASIASRSM
jgi:uncharacterized protein YndB with AHSA1/START domain